MTEIKAPYTFAPAPSPELSIADLRQLRQQYLCAGAENFEALALITKTLGSPVEIRGRVYWIYQSGRVTALYQVESERYMANESRYEETEVLSVFLDMADLRGLDNPERVQVCYLRCGDVVLRPEQKFIPGQWMQDMLADYAVAENIVEQQRQEAIERERQALIKELMIGKGI